MDKHSLVIIHSHFENRTGLLFKLGLPSPSGFVLFKVGLSCVKWACLLPSGSVLIEVGLSYPEVVSHVLSRSVLSKVSLFCP